MRSLNYADLISDRIDISPRLNIETPEDEGRDGLDDFPGSPTIIIQVTGLTIYDEYSG